MWAAIGRMFAKEVILKLWNELVLFINNWWTAKEAEKKAKEAEKKYNNSPTPDQRDQDAEDLLNRR